MLAARRYFADGTSLYACEAHVLKRQAMGMSYQFTKLKERGK